METSLDQRVLNYLRRQEYEIEYGKIEYKDRWYAPAVQLMESLLWR